VSVVKIVLKLEDERFKNILNFYVEYWYCSIYFPKYKKRDALQEESLKYTTPLYWRLQCDSYRQILR